MFRRYAFCCRRERAEASFRPIALRLTRRNMTSFGSGKIVLGMHRTPARLWLRSLQAAGLALLLSTLPIGAPAKAAAPSAATTGAHVYLLRGVLNIFSLGLDDIAAR